MRSMRSIWWVAAPVLALAACAEPAPVVPPLDRVPATQVTLQGAPGTDRAPEEPPPFEGLTIAAVGDWYEDDPEDGGFLADAEATRDAIIAVGPDLVLGLGDFTYDRTDPQPFFDFIAPLEAVAPLWPAFGNHDGINAGAIRRPNFYRKMLEHFGTGPFYVRDVGPVRFISINSEYTEAYGGHEDQVRHVEAALQDASADPEVAIVLPFFHKSMVNPVTEQGPSPVLQDVYLPLLEAHAEKIPLALQAHHHIYTRTHPVQQAPGRDESVCREEGEAEVCQADYIVVDEGAGSAPAVYRNREGIVFATVGTGGAHAQGLTPETDYVAVRHRPTSVTEDEAGGTFGFLLITIPADASRVEVEFRANDGSVLDHFVIEVG